MKELSDQQLEAQANEFYWAGHMGSRMPNPTRSAEARLELHKREVLSGKKKVFGQYPYDTARKISGGMPFEKWRDAVKRAIKNGFDVPDEVRKEAA